MAKRYEPGPEQLAKVNELVESGTPMGCYCLGLLTAFFWDVAGRDAPLDLMELVARSNSIEEMMKSRDPRIQRVLREQRAKKNRGSSS